MKLISKLGGRKFIVTIIANVLVLFLEIDELSKAKLLAALNSVYIGVQGTADAISKGKTSSSASK